MSEVLKVEIATICIVHIISIILAIIFLVVFYIKANKGFALKAFLVMQISIIGWMVFKIFKTVSPDETTRWWFIVGYYLCACIFEVAFLEFAYAYYKGKPIGRRIRILIYILPFTQFLWVVTNPMHHLFYSKYDFWGDSFGQLFYLHTLIEYGFISVGFVYGYLTFKKRFIGKKLWIKLLIASAIILPLILNFLFITKVIHKFAFSIGIPVIFDITPIVFVFSTLVFAYATFNHDFMNLTPIMKKDIVHKLDTPICVLDAEFQVIYLNEKLTETLGEDMTRKLMKDIDVLKIIGEKEEIKIDDYSFIIHIHEVKALEKQQYLVTLNNVTDYKNIEEKILSEQMELVKTNEELEATIDTLRKTSKIGARNYVARELHDIIGHSLVVTLKLLEVAKLYFDKDKPLSNATLADGIASIDAGINSMNAITLKEDSYTSSDLEKDISKMLSRIKVTELKTSLSFKGIHYILEEKTYDIINRICHELVTNALKHSEAKEIFLSINIKKEDINILVIDNGVGCDKLVLGNGLKGIVERLRLINGKVEFITSKQEGFMSKISIIK